MTRESKAHFALATVGIIYGSNYVIAKSVMPEPIDPDSFIALRVLGAVFLFWLLAARNFQWPKRKDLMRFVLCGLTGVTINQLFFFNGLALTAPVNGAIIMTSNPIMVMIISSLLLGTVITFQKIAGVVIGAIGAISLLVLSSSQDLTGLHFKGDMFILINSLSYAFYLVLVKPLMQDYKPTLVIAWVFTFGLIGVLPFGGLGLTEISWSLLDGWQWAAVAFVVLIVTFLTYLLNIYAIYILGPATASAYVYFQPFLAGLFSFLFAYWAGKENTGEITWSKVACTLLIFVGVFLVSSSERLQLKLNRR